MIRKLTKADVGKIFKRQWWLSSKGYSHRDYIRIRKVRPGGDYSCDFLERPGVQNVEQGEAGYDYEEVSELEVLVVCGVVI